MSVSTTIPPRMRRARLPVHLEPQALQRSVATGEASLVTSRRIVARQRQGLAHLSDEVLLARYRDSKQPEDFGELVRRYSGALGRHLARYLGNPVLAEDALQDTFLQVHAKCALYRDGWPVRPWLYTVAIHCAIDATRRAKHLPAIRLEQPCGAREVSEPGPLLDLLASDEPGPLEEIEEQERQLWVRNSIAKLSEPLRQVLALAYDRELSYAEIASLLKIPIGTVKSRLHTAVASLRAMAVRLESTR